jgi:hypothetical protein
LWLVKNFKKVLNYADIPKEVVKMFSRKKSRGQSILEYVIVLAALVAGFALARSKLQSNATNSLTSVGQATETAVTAIKFLK